MFFLRTISGNNFEKEKLLCNIHGREVTARWSSRSLLILAILQLYDSLNIKTYILNNLSAYKKIIFSCNFGLLFTVWAFSCVFKVQHSTSWVTWSLYFKDVSFLMRTNVNSVQRRNKVLMQKFARFWNQTMYRPV